MSDERKLTRIEWDLLYKSYKKTFYELADERDQRIRELELQLEAVRKQFDEYRRDEPRDAIRLHREKMTALDSLWAAQINERRYLWLRDRAFKDGGNLAMEVIGAYDNHVGGSVGEGLDRAIDSAMEKQP